MAAEDPFLEGYRHALRMLLSDCTNDPELILNDPPHGQTTLKDYVSSLIRQYPIRPASSTTWTPPAFDDAHNYILTACREHRELIPFGNIKDVSLKANFDGRVTCWDRIDEGDLFGYGTLEIIYTTNVKQLVRVFVLGSIAHTGTAVLLDNNLRVWLYNTPDAVDQQLKGMNCQAALIMEPGDVMTSIKRITFLKEHTETRLIMDQLGDEE